MISTLGFEDLAWSFSGSPPTSTLTIHESAFLWKLVKQSTGPIGEVGRVDSSSTMLLAAAGAGRPVLSRGRKNEIKPPVLDFLVQRNLRGQVEFRSSVPFTNEMEMNYGLLVIHTTKDEGEFGARLLTYWSLLDRVDGCAPIVAVIVHDKEGELAWKKQITALNGNACAESLGAVGQVRAVRRVDHPWASRYLGVANYLRSKKHFECAHRMYQLCRVLNPEWPNAVVDEGRCYAAQKNDEKAAECYEAAIKIKPTHEVYFHLGGAHMRLGNAREAIVAFRHSLRMKPDYETSILNLGHAYNELGRQDLADKYLNKVLEKNPEAVFANYVKSRAYTAAGRLEEGHSLFRWRWKLSKPPSGLRKYTMPEWAGEPLEGKRILVWGEQGIGDQIAYLSMVPDLVRMGATGSIECNSKLVTLVRRSFTPQFEVFPMKGEPNPRMMTQSYDYHSSMGAMAEFLRKSIDDFPKKCSYLKLDPEKVAYWKQRLDSLGDTVKVGLGWKSRLMHSTRKKHYVPLEAHEPILRVEGCTFISLQYNDCIDDIEMAREKFGVDIEYFEDLDLFNDMESTLAMCSVLDAGVTTKYSTPVNYLTVVDVPTFTYGCGWIERNMGEENLPWFPSARDFKWDWDDDREPYMQAIALELRRFVRAHDRKKRLGLNMNGLG